MTKCGRYGTDREAFDYSPRTIRRSVERSLSRLNTDYLDVVYLHDVEFVAEEIMPRTEGNHLGALRSEAEAYGLKEGLESRVWGKGDQIVLDAFQELRKLQSEGVIRKIGITGSSLLHPSCSIQSNLTRPDFLSRMCAGYPLPTLLRLAVLIFHSPPYKPIDILLSYSQSNIQNAAFTSFAPHFRSRAHVGQLISASPLNMGLLTPRVPAWHPAPEELREATREAVRLCEDADWEGGLPNVALGYAMREESALPTPPPSAGGKLSNGNGAITTQEVLDSSSAGVSGIPVVVGLSTPGEVHQAVKAWREVHEEDETAAVRRKAMEQRVVEIYSKAGYENWAWSSPPKEA